MLRLSRIKKYKLEKKQNRKMILLFFVIIPIISTIVGYVIVRIFITPMFATILI